MLQRVRMTFRRQVKPAFIQWNPGVYGAAVAEILALAENGERLMPLAEGTCCSDEARQPHQEGEGWRICSLELARRAPLWPASIFIFPAATKRTKSRNPIPRPRAVTGTPSCTARSRTPAIRRTGFIASANTRCFRGCWRRRGSFGAAHPDAALKFSKAWDPFAFIDICEQARRQPGFGTGARRSRNPARRMAIVI